MKDYFKISVVVPCFNAELYIESTIKSIINQDYPNLELILVDGLSTDCTMKIVAKYSNHFTHIISERDNGQYNAINKGFSIATGDIYCWLNADDIYLPWTFNIVNHIFKKFETFSWISGIPAFTDENNFFNSYNVISSKPSSIIKNGGFRKNIFGFLQQESMFWKKEIWDEAGGINEEYSLAGDFDLWLKFSQVSELISVGSTLAAFRKHTSNRSVVMGDKYDNEVASILQSKISKYRMIYFFSKRSRVINKLIRLLVWRKCPTVFYSVLGKEWIFRKCFRPLSNNSIERLIIQS